MTKIYYAFQLNNDDILNKSSSGGAFYALAKYTFDNNGVVYGAAWSKTFEEVNIERVDKITYLDKLMTSKYVISNAKQSYELIKNDLEEGKLVLYSGLPCQIFGLKTFLNQDYDNLICVEIVCHGVLPNNIWKDYIDSIKKPGTKIVSVNMKDKRLGWQDYGISIKYNDGTEFFESHKNNKYIKAFLCDKYLNKSCYNCKFKNENSKADITIGDFWGLNPSNTRFNNHNKGVSVIAINTEKGLKIFNTIDCIKYQIDAKVAALNNGGMSNKINTEPAEYNKDMFKKEIGILTLNFNNNIGGVLQAWSLQKFLSDNNYNSTILQSHTYSGNLSFVKNKKVKYEVVTDFDKIEPKCDTFIVGSDQVWRREFIEGKWEDSWKSWRPLFLDFAEKWNVNRIAYAASCGNNKFDFGEDLPKIKSLLGKFNHLSTREIDFSNTICELTDKQVTVTCDPTLLLDREQYLNICKDIKQKSSGLFSYILDNNEKKKKAKDKIISQLKLAETKMSTNSVEEWLACYRDCSCVLTDSYHGVLFALIFNKPFICFNNDGRGSSRFNTLVELFPKISNRIIKDTDSINLQLEKMLPNVYGSSLWVSLTGYSKEFLLSSLKNEEDNTKQLSKVFGLVSYIPDTDPARKLRIERLDRAFKQITDIFPDANFLVIAQNWKNYEVPESVKNINVFKYDKLGILGARKKLREHFLQLGYDYLIMCDDDIILKTELKNAGVDFMIQIDKHPDGFMFLQYDAAQLNLCAISRYVYEHEPMVDIDPQKNEGYEDTIFSRLLHYKYKDREFFSIPGIRCTQFLNKEEKAPSTWAATNNHELNWKSVVYHVERFKNGQYEIDKTLGKHAKDIEKVKKVFAKLPERVIDKIKPKLMKKYNIKEDELK